jgi:hypothetical protein
LLGSDLIYEMSNVEPLVAFIKRVLTPGGVCLLTDQDRIPVRVFRNALENQGLPYATRIMRAGEPGGRGRPAAQGHTVPHHASSLIASERKFSARQVICTAKMLGPANLRRYSCVCRLFPYNLSGPFHYYAA